MQIARQCEVETGTKHLWGGLRSTHLYIGIAYTTLHTHVWLLQAARLISGSQPGTQVGLAHNLQVPAGFQTDACPNTTSALCQ